MLWVKENADVVSATQGFIRIFGSVQDPVVEVSRNAADDNARIAWVLFGSALFQKISFPAFRKVFSAIFDAYPGERLWNFPLPAETALLRVAKAELGRIAWDNLEQLPGIFWSTGSFVRHHGPLADWLKQHTVRELWRDLGEIHFMGKKAHRPKAVHTLLRLLAPAPVGLGLACAPSADALPLPLTMGARRWIGFVGPGKDLHYSTMDESAKLRLGLSLYPELCRETPALAAHGLQFFLEDGSSDFLCREYTETCVKCPLSPFCCKSKAETYETKF
ncbi:MAG: hypothetical protein WCS54_05395 [Fibrobacteraceae bacterium]